MRLDGDSTKSSNPFVLKTPAVEREQAVVKPKEEEKKAEVTQKKEEPAEAPKQHYTIELNKK